jgi:hypothetical protein
MAGLFGTAWATGTLGDLQGIVGNMGSLGSFFLYMLILAIVAAVMVVIFRRVPTGVFDGAVSNKVHDPQTVWHKLAWAVLFLLLASVACAIYFMGL